MALPDTTFTIVDGALGQIPANTANVQCKMGVCSRGTPNTVYAIGDLATAQSTLGDGPMVDALAHTLAVAGGPVYAIPMDIPTAGTAGSVTHTGTGAATVTPTVAPDRQILVKVTTGGTLGTVCFAYSVGGGEYSAPVTSTGPGTFVYRVPGTLCKVLHAAGTYVINDVYTITTAGGITKAGTGPDTITQVSSPIDAYNVIVTIVVGGAVGTATFRYSLDGNNSVSAEISTGTGTYVIPGTGIVLTWSGTSVAGDTYAFATSAAAFSTTEANAGFVALQATSYDPGFVHVVGTPSSAANAASLASAVDTKMTALQTAYRFAWALTECPTSEVDATVAAAFASFASTRVMVAAGDALLASPMTGLKLRRNGAWVIAARAAKVAASAHLGQVGNQDGNGGPVSNVSSLYRDEAATPGLDIARFATLRTFPGLAGYYITNGRLMATGGSDFSEVQFRRVMDIACKVARSGILQWLNKSVRVDASTGYIDERDAVAFEAEVNAKLKAALVDPGYASSTSVTVSRTQNILSTSTEPVTVRVVPLGYLEYISVNIGFYNPATA